MRYDSASFGGRSLDDFVGALQGEGIRGGRGYRLLSGHDALKTVSAKYPHLMRTTPCPNVESVSARVVWFGQNMLMGTRKDMDDIVEAVALSQGQVSHHLACLTWCGLVAFERRGRLVEYRVSDPRLVAIFDMAHAFLDHNDAEIAACRITT